MKHQPDADISSYTRRCPPPHKLFLHFHLRGLSEMSQKLLTLRAAADIFIENVRVHSSTFAEKVPVEQKSFTPHSTDSRAKPREKWVLSEKTEIGCSLRAYTDLDSFCVQLFLIKGFKYCNQLMCFNKRSFHGFGTPLLTFSLSRVAVNPNSPCVGAVLSSNTFWPHTL